jgi:regulator of RNase E activity RraA
MRQYEVRIRFQGSVTTVQVQARDNAHAKALVKAQYNDKVVVMEARPTGK